MVIDRLGVWKFSQGADGSVKISSRFGTMVQYGPQYATQALLVLAPAESAALSGAVGMGFYTQTADGIAHYLLLTPDGLPQSAALVANLPSDSKADVVIISLNQALSCLPHLGSCVQAFDAGEVWLRLPAGTPLPQQLPSGLGNIPSGAKQAYQNQMPTGSSVPVLTVPSAAAHQRPRQSGQQAQKPSAQQRS